MPALDALFTTIEQYDKMNARYLQVRTLWGLLANGISHCRPQYSKIGKVMRLITALPSKKVPRDGKFRFKARANALIDQWHQILSANKLNGSAADDQANSTDAVEGPPRKKQRIFAGQRWLEGPGLPNWLLGY